MAIKQKFSVYPFAEMIEVETNGTTAVDVLSIPKYTIIEGVLVRIKTAATGDANNLIIGDDDDDNGYIVAADAKGTAGTVYGDDPTERGAYLYDATKKGGFVKLYAAAGKEIKVVLSTAATTEAVLQVFVFGKRFAV